MATLLQHAPSTHTSCCWAHASSRSVTLPRRLVRQFATGKSQQSVALAALPSDYDAALRQAHLATKAAIADGLRLLEVELPASGLTAAQGEGDGQGEMNSSMRYLRQYLGGWADRPAGVRVFFPDNVERAVASSGQTSDPAAGRQAMDAVFGPGCGFKLGHLTQQSAAWALLGMNLGSSFSPAAQLKDSDELLVVAYPSFNPREELCAARSLWDAVAADPSGPPFVLFNAELDRLRGGYYPSLFFPELARLTREWLPQVEASWYLRNIKGSKPGALFRCYPGPWQVLRRAAYDPDVTQVVWQGDERPSLKTVALEILPGS